MSTASNATGVSASPSIKTSKGEPINAPVDLPITMDIASRNPVSGKSTDWWPIGAIDGQRWNRLYPFQLMVVEAVASGEESGDDETGKATTSYNPTGRSFTLPMPPEAYSVSSPFAINTTVTLGGIVEEHNAIPIKMIQLRGTMGVFPGRDRASEQSAGKKQAMGVAAGTIKTLKKIAVGAVETFGSITGAARRSPNIHTASEFGTSFQNRDDKSTKTGYYQFRLLQNFLEQYSAIKTTSEGKNLRLALCMWKDQSIYLVTPVNFNVSKDASSPFEYRYDLTLKAWRRIYLGATSFAISLDAPARRSPSVMAAILNTLSAARRTIQGVGALPGAIIGDADATIFEPIRQGMLLAKDTVGAALTIADAPNALKRKYETRKAWIEGTASEISSGAQRVIGVNSKSDKDARGKVQRSAVMLKAQQAFRQQQKAQKDKDASRAAAETIRGVGRAEKAAAYADQMLLSSLALDAATKQQILADRDRIIKRTRKDAEDTLDAWKTTHAKYEAAVGAGSATVSDLYGITVTPIKGTPTSSDWRSIYALNAVRGVLSTLAVTSSGDPGANVGRVDVMAAMNRRSGTAFTTPRSKYPVPFPYGTTLERLATTYLGSADRAAEIIALNGLREPYIDEVGFDLPLVVNGKQSTIVVDLTDNLYVGQMVTLWSRTASRSSRRITSMRTVGNNIVLTVDGNVDLSRYLVSDGAMLHAYLPDTVNSQQVIYLPSDVEPLENEFVTKSIPGANELDPMVAAGGVDLLLDSNLDLIFTEDGDTRMSVGLTNIVQGINIAISCKRGGLLHHPDYGLPIEVGDTTSDVSPNQIAEAISSMLSNDSSYLSVTKATVNQVGGKVMIDAAVTVAGLAMPIPVNYLVERTLT